MDTTEISRVIFKGPENAIKRYRGEAISQLNILDDFMSFQGLKQGRRLVTLASGVIISCTKVFGLRVAEIVVPTFQADREAIIRIPTFLQYLLLVYGSPEEYIDIYYLDDSPLFTAEHVNCTAGSGDITAVEDSRLYGTFTMCWEALIYGASSEAVAAITDAIERHFLRLYQKQEIISTGLSETAPVLKRSVLQSSLDVWPLSNVPAQGYSRMGYEWTKTLGPFILTAFSFYLDLPYLGAKKWAVSASLGGKVVTWLGSSYFPDIGFSREICKQATCDVGTSWIDVHIGFDVWTESNPETGADDYYVGLMADVEALFMIWKLNSETAEMELQIQYSSTIREDYFEEAFHPLRHVRLLGYGHIGGEDRIYWGTPGYFSGYYLEDPEDGSVEFTDTSGGLNTALWNPIFRTLHTVSEEGSETDDPEVSTRTYRGQTDQWNQQGYACMCYGYYQYHACTPCEGGSWTPYGTSYVYEPLYSGKCSFDTLGLDYFAGDTTIGQIVSSTQTRYGNFIIDGTSYPKGSKDAEINQNTILHVREPYASQGACDPGVQWTTNWTISVQCVPNERKDYEFLGGVFSPAGAIAYMYRQAEYLEVPNPLDPGTLDFPLTICERQDFEAPVIIGGDEADVIMSEFPYDYNWRAILLEGTGRINEEEDTLIAVPREGAVIYQRDNGSLFLMGSGFETTELGTHERGFFKQVTIRGADKEIKL